MKYRIITCLIFLCALIVWVFGSDFSSNSDTHQAFNIHDVENEKKIEMPIKDTYDAARYAYGKMSKKIGQISEDHDIKSHNWIVESVFMNADRRRRLKNKLIKKNKYDARMKNMAGTPDFWRVLFRTENLIPSYACIVSFDLNGVLVFDGRDFNWCGWNK